MRVKVAMYEKSWAHIRGRAEALGLDLEVTTFDAEGRFDGQAPEAVEADYMWLSTHLNADGVGAVAFDVAKRLKRLDVIQTFNAGLDNPVYREISARGTRVCNSSAQGVAIAEYAFAQVIALLHPLEEQRAMQAEKRWGKTLFREISRTHWLIVGYGPIGAAVAKRAKGFEAGVSVIRRSPGAAEHIAAILDYWEAHHEDAPDAQLAYVLATAFWESGRFKHREEIGKGASRDYGESLLLIRGNALSLAETHML